MSDFGFGSLVGKYEEYFGRFVTRIILIVVGLAVVATGVGAVWTWLVSPLLAFFRTPVWGQSLTQLTLTAVAIGGGIALSFAISQELVRLRHVRAIKKIRDDSTREFEAIISETRQRTDALIDQAHATRDEASADVAHGREVLTMATELFKGIVAAHPKLTDAERLELLARVEQNLDDSKKAS